MKTFPILTPNAADLKKLLAANVGLITEIPWAMIAPCEARAMSNNGGRTLEQLAADGGMSAGETVAVLRDWNLQMLSVEASYIQLEADLQAWMHVNEERDDG